jgi:nucleoside-diphosphate-sugar epimerase
MKIAITGASGFLGRHLLPVLLQHSVDIVALTRDPSLLSEWNNAIQILPFDLDNGLVNPFEECGSPDCLIHLAWEGLGNYRSLDHFERQLPVHYQFLKQMITAGLPALFVAGTCFEYGLCEGALGEDIPTEPVLPYAYAKDALRRQLQLLQQKFKFSLCWGRVFYLYGEGQAKNSLYTQLMEALDGQQKSFNMSGGEQLRDYLPVESLVNVIAELALKRADSGPVNLCSGAPISIRRLVEGWVKSREAQIKLNLGHYPYPDYEPMGYWGNRGRLDYWLHDSI